MLLTPLLLALFFSYLPQVAHAESAPCNTYSWTNDDDGSFGPLNLPFSLPLGNTTYNQVYASTNGTLTFGAPDGTYWDYPQTPSLTVAGYDWVSWNGGYLQYGTSSNQLCMEWQVRPFPQSTGVFTNIKVVITVGETGWQGLITTTGWLPNNVRRGIRFERGQAVVPIDEAFIVNGGIPIEVQPSELPIPPTPEPTPTPTPTPTDTPLESPTPTPTPSETIQPTPEPSPTQTQDPDPIQPDPNPTPVVIPTDEPVIEVPQEVQEEVEQILEPSIEPTPIEEIISEQEEINNAIDELILNEEEISDEQLQDITDLLLDNYEVSEVMPIAELLIELNDEQVLELLEQLDQNQVIEYREGVEIEAGVAVIFEKLTDPAALIGELFSNPSQVAEAFGQLGADMTEKEREDSQDVVVASIIATQAIGAAMAAIPLTPSTPTGGTSSPSGSGGGSGGGDSGGGGESEGKDKKLKGKRKPKLKNRRNTRRIK
jgi:predicted transcriptional regulator